MVAAVSLDNLSKTYTLDLLKGRRRVVALSGLSLSVAEGEVLGVLGPNGAGKSTTLKLILNLIRPTSGVVRVFGHEPSSPEARRNIGFLPENPVPYEYLTGEEFVRFAGSLSGLSGAELSRRVTAVLEQVQMDRFLGVQIRRYSKGMTQRIALAQALVANPRLLILDEPTSGLDVLGRQLIRDIIIAEKKRGTTVLLCSHIIPDVEALAEKVAILIGGKLVRSGPVNEMLSAEGSRVELTLEGLSSQKLQALNPEIVQDGARLIVRVDASEARKIIEAAYQSGARLISMHPIRNTLEGAFLEAVRSSNNKVGSSIE